MSLVSTRCGLSQKAFLLNFGGKKAAGAFVSIVNPDSFQWCKFTLPFSRKIKPATRQYHQGFAWQGPSFNTNRRHSHVMAAASGQQVNGAGGSKPQENEASENKPRLTIDIVSDTVCPWCFVGKKNLEKAIEASKVNCLHAPSECLSSPFKSYFTSLVCQIAKQRAATRTKRSLAAPLSFLCNS
jgi:hypothetical protein